MPQGVRGTFFSHEDTTARKVEDSPGTVLCPLPLASWLRVNSDLSEVAIASPRLRREKDCPPYLGLAVPASRPCHAGMF